MPVKRIVTPEYKEAVVIGNGPSGISVSYMLAGNTPYYKGVSEDENLDIRLNKFPDVPLVLQDLEFLSEGLEGRSNNPFSLLFDALAHPNADLGGDNPSLLNWKFREDFMVDHVVLGKNAPGGQWASIEGDMLTVSLGSWMELPNLKISDLFPMNESSSRIRASWVSKYYKSYVLKMNLDKYFKTGTFVTSVERIEEDPEDAKIPYEKDDSVDFECVFDEYSARDEEIEWGMNSCDPIYNPLLFGGSCRYSLSSHPPTRRSNCVKGSSLWKVCGIQKTTTSSAEIPFEYWTRNVILAIGSQDTPNVLGVPGEDEAGVLRSLRDVEREISAIKASTDPLLIIGDGLSAADAVIYAKDNDVSTVHVFRQRADDRNIIFYKLPKLLYMEYHAVHRMMRSELTYKKYKPIPGCDILEIIPNDDDNTDSKKPHRVVLSNGDVVSASKIVSFVGSVPALQFFRGEPLPFFPNEPPSKNNPVDIDGITHESISNPGVYAMGPLVGDNFVRFLQGGALAIAADIIKKRNLKSSQSVLS